MRAYMQCGACMDEAEVRGLETVEQVLTVQYAFWARHAHTDEARVELRERMGQPGMADPANIPQPIEDWEREVLMGDDDGDDS
jgi:hypothetical protein